MIRIMVCTVTNITRGYSLIVVGTSVYRTRILHIINFNLNKDGSYKGNYISYYNVILFPHFKSGAMKNILLISSFERKCMKLEKTTGKVVLKHLTIYLLRLFTFLIYVMEFCTFGIALKCQWKEEVDSKSNLPCAKQ